MSEELEKLIIFVQTLQGMSMRHDALVVRAYDYALALCCSREESNLPASAEISSTLQAQIMKESADLLETAIHGFAPPAGYTIA